MKNNFWRLKRKKAIFDLLRQNFTSYENDNEKKMVQCSISKPISTIFSLKIHSKRRTFREKLIKISHFVAYLRNILYLCIQNININMEQTVFELDLLEEARDFLKSLTKEIRGKIGYNIRRVQKGERDNELFKKLDGTEIWEFRTIYNKMCYRLFAFWDKDINTLVVATHGIVKKTQKTPKSEITKAEGIRKLYFENKNKKI